MVPDRENAEVFDSVIVGAGVVGCAMARRLTLDGARVCVIEAASDILNGASKGNSGILHTGFDAPPGSLERECIEAGYREYLTIKDKLGLPLLETGALVMAWTEEEADRLPSLMEQAHENGVTEAALLSRSQIHQREPHLADNFKAGFLVPGEYVIDPWSAPTGYLLQALGNGAVLLRNTKLERGTFDGKTWTLHTSNGPLTSREVINCAGLYGDTVEQALLGSSSFQIRPRKGQFVVFDKSASRFLKSIVLPVPSPTTKGVVICPTAYGNILVGPTAEEQDSRSDASVDTAALTMLRDTAVRLIPALADQPVTATYAGIRPATEEKGYRITQHADQNYICVGGIRSTGLSAALGIARHVAALRNDAGDTGTPLEDPVWPGTPRLAEGSVRAWQEPDNGGIVCHCELVTRREIEDALEGPLAAQSLGGLKRRTRVTMGRCQGFYCSGALAKLTEGRLTPALGERT